MKTIKTVIAAALVIGSVACKNESADIDAPSCVDVVAIAQGNFDLANVRLSELTAGRTGVTAQRDDIISKDQSEASEMIQLQLTDVDAEIEEFDGAIIAQNDVVSNARESLINAVLACPIANQAQVESLRGNDGLDEELEALLVAEEAARTTIADLGPLIIEAYEEIQSLEGERALAVEEKAALEADTSAVDASDIATQMALIEGIEVSIRDIDADLLAARRRHVQYADARRMTYLSLNTTVAAKEGIEAQN